MASRAKIVRDPAYWEMGKAFAGVMAMELNDALKDCRVTDARKRKKICERFLFGMGNFLDQYWFAVEGEKHYPLMCFTKKFMNVGMDPSDVGTVYAPSKGWEYHAAASDMTEWFFKDQKQDSNAVRVGVFGEEEPELEPVDQTPPPRRRKAKPAKPSLKTADAAATLEALGAMLVENRRGRVEEVSLWHAGIGDDDLSLVGQLVNLKELYIHESKVTDAGLKHLRALKNLQTLSLATTPVTNAGLKHLRPLTSLRFLNLSGTQISDDGLKHLKPLENLRDLSLDKTAVQGRGLAHLKRLPRLDSLDLSEMQVGDAGLAQLKHLTSVTTLILAKAGITDDRLEHLKHVKNLRVLILNENAIKGPGLPQLAELGKLKILGLEKTKLTNATLTYLEDLTRLSTLNLGRTRTTQAGIKKLKKALPKCQISK